MSQARIPATSMSDDHPSHRWPAARRLAVGILPGALSGVLLGISHPPADLPWLIWVALVPLLWVVQRQPRGLQAFLPGVAAGFALFAITIHPATSAHLWSGWQTAETVAEHESMVSRQFVVLNVVWIGLSLWGALFWGACTLLLSRLAQGSLWRLALLAPPTMIVVTEWLRSLATFDYQWAFLGNAAIHVHGILQLAALGGVSLLSWLVVLVNVGILALALLPRRPRQWLLPGSVAALFALAAVGGSWQEASLESRWQNTKSIATAGIQYHKPRSETTPLDFTPLGFEKAYLELMQQVARGEAGEIDLLVLPESIAFGTLSLDGSKVPQVPEQFQWPRQKWAETITDVIDLSDRNLAIILGVDTVADEAIHNSTTFWTQDGLQNVYHKQRPVPLAEYQPALFEFLGMQGEMQYQAGQSSRIGELHQIPIGAFICQEVLIASVTRQSVRDGAELLVSGGNDGVFQDPAFAEVHAGLARLRAVESGRFIVRVMKTGISAIISPSGAEISRSPSSEPYVVVNRVHALDHQTPYVRFGNWPLGLAGLVLSIALLVHFRRGRMRPSD